MKIFKLMAVALVAMLGFTACNKACEHEFIEHDFTNELVGTWTYVNGGQAEAMVIKADGSFTTTGVMEGGYLYEEKGTIKVVNNKVTLAFDGDKETFEGRLELVAGKSLSLVMFDDNDVRLTYDYCENDLSDEILGMWVCHEGLPGVENDMLIMTFSENGKMTMTTSKSAFIPFDYVNEEVDYVIVGDLLFKNFYGENPAEGYIRCQSSRLTYSPNATTLGDILIENIHAPYQNNTVELNVSFLRVKQNLDLAGKAYDYNNIYVTNVKAKDAEFEFAGQTLNLATMDGSILDKMMKNLLFNVSFPSADKIVYNYHYNGENVHVPSPIVVDGNKMTIKKSVNNPACKDIDVWTFQDQDNTQMHMYMPVKSFENFLANTAVEMMANEGKLDLNDAAAVKAIFDEVEAAIETINVSFIFKTAK